MSIYTIKTRDYVCENNRAETVYSPDTLSLSVRCGDIEWSWKEDCAKIMLTNGKTVHFTRANCESSLFTNGVTDGVRAAYSGFSDEDGTSYSFTAVTFVGFDRADGTLRAEITVENDGYGEIKRVCWPSPFEFDLPKGKGYSVLSQMQGVLLPSRWQGELPKNSGGTYTRNAYMPFYGQINGKCGYLAIVDTPFDACLAYNHTPGGPTEPEVLWRTSLGHIGTRIMLYRFYADCNYVTFAKAYREYVKSRGNFKTLKQKIDENPNIEYLLGAPIIHDGIAVHITEKSHYYDKNDPSKNDYYVTFTSRGEKLRAIKERGLEKAYLHLDGWGFHGYDNLHPSPFPPHEKAGGADGMRALSDTCAALGYKFGVHDQYRDYFYDGPDYISENAVSDINGKNYYNDWWYGGAQSILCATLAPKFVKRNYDEFERLGIRIDGSYLDVFSIAGLDECFNPLHKMTREQCAMYRREAFHELTRRGIITSSEEVVDSVLSSLALCHHAPFASQPLDETQSQACGIPIPLFNLVYHECIVVPWFGLEGKGGWGLPSDQNGFLWALLTGGTIYHGIDDTAEKIEKGRIVCALHKRLAHCEMVRHEFTDGSFMRHRAVYSDGTVIEADMDTETYKITYPGSK